MASNGVNGTHKADGNLQGSSPCSTSRVTPRPKTQTGSLDNNVQIFKTQLKPIFRSLLTPPLVNDSKNTQITLKECLKKFQENEESFKTVAGPILIEYLADLVTQLITQNETRVNYIGTPAALAFEQEWTRKMSNLRTTEHILNAPYCRATLMEFSVKFKAFSVEDQHSLREFMYREIVVLASDLIHTIDIERNKVIAHYVVIVNRQHAEINKMAENSQATIAAFIKRVAERQKRICELEQEKNVLSLEMEGLKQRNASFEKEVKENNLRIERLDQKLKKMAEDLEKKTREEANLRSAAESHRDEIEEDNSKLGERIAQCTMENQELKSRLDELEKETKDNRNAAECLERQKTENDDLRKQVEELTNRMETHQIKILAVLDDAKKTESTRESNEQIRRLIQAICIKKDDSKTPNIASNQTGVMLK
ncbi:hypothetical protein GCK72_022760 [Caenorhabditis remanei]|uniref:Uncharacterized protein n=1 Tax=Caenorhabditis remanei TaxID=31234 RepID=A0A6A5FUP0_CAERE|nr:hypothetical protein GCK72_022760 [Caenorhabditis remanei]KAF1746307.1 hypothetical protein GCK72_022760 [Caenorhabditis remanei]